MFDAIFEIMFELVLPFPGAIISYYFFNKNKRDLDEILSNDRDRNIGISLAFIVTIVLVILIFA